MKNTPPGWPRISSAVYYEDPIKAIDWLCRSFGFVVPLKAEADDGSIVHSELTFGEGVVMVATSGGNPAHPEAANRDTSHRNNHSALGAANTQSTMTYSNCAQQYYATYRPTSL